MTRPFPWRLWLKLKGACLPGLAWFIVHFSPGETLLLAVLTIIPANVWVILYWTGRIQDDVGAKMGLFSRKARGRTVGAWERRRSNILWLLLLRGRVAWARAAGRHLLTARWRRGPGARSLGPGATRGWPPQGTSRAA